MPRTLLIIACIVSFASLIATAAERPNIVLVMADDMGWGQTGYYSHPILKTPNLDAMAAAGLRMDRFYAGARCVRQLARPCSPDGPTIAVESSRMAMLCGGRNGRSRKL